MSALKTIIKIIFNIFQFIVLLTTIGVLLYLYVIQVFQVKGNSMHPTYKNGEYLLINKLSYRDSEPDYGDVLIFQAPDHPEFDYIKRVIARPGDEVLLEDGKFYVNEELIDESPYLQIPEEDYFLYKKNRTCTTIYQQTQTKTQIEDSKKANFTIPTKAGRFLKEGETITIPDNELFLVGDDRPCSSDSRDYGSVSINKVYGEVFVRLWPISQFSWINNPYESN